MPFDKKGFLGSDAQDLVRQHRRKFAVWFEVADTLNEVAHENLKQMKVHQGNIQEVTCASLYLRVLGSFSAAVRLLELGLSQDAGTVLRSQVESTIFLTACGSDKDFLEEFHYSSELFRLTLANISLQGEDGAIVVTEANRAKLIAVKIQIEKLIEEGKVKKLNVGEIAKKFGLSGMYNTAYRFLSNNHAHSGSLQQLFKFQSDGSIDEILWKPNMSDIEHLMFTSCACMTHSFGLVTEVFKISKDVTQRLEARVNAAMERIKAIVPRSPKQEL